MPEKIGRPPSDNPKDVRITVRLDKDMDTILEKYCYQENISKADAIRRGIIKLMDDIEQK